MTDITISIINCRRRIFALLFAVERAGFNGRFLAGFEVGAMPGAFLCCRAFVLSFAF